MKEVIHFQQLCIYHGKLPKTELILGIHWILAEYLITSNETHVVVAVSSVIPAGMYLVVPFSKRRLVLEHLCTGNQLARNFIFKKGLRNAAHRSTMGYGCSGWAHSLFWSPTCSPGTLILIIVGKLLWVPVCPQLLKKGVSH